MIILKMVIGINEIWGIAGVYVWGVGDVSGPRDHQSTLAYIRSS